MSGLFPWDDVKRERAKHLYLVDGLSAGLISDALTAEFKHKVSRSAVIGALSRMGVKRQGPAKPRVEKERIMPKRKPRPPALPSTTCMVAGQEVTPKGPAARKKDGRPAFSQLTGLRVQTGAGSKPGFFPPEPAARLPLRLTLMELEPRSCRWPVTAGAPFLFCGHRSTADGPYCEDHQRARSAKDQVRAMASLESHAKRFSGAA